MYSTKSRYGAENHIMRVACGAARHGFEVHAAFPKVEGTASMVQECEAAGISHRPFDWRPSRQAVECKAALPAALFQIPWFLQMRRLLRDVRPDVVQLTVNSWRGLWVSSLSCAHFGVPTLVVFQGPGGAKWAMSPARIKAFAWARRRQQRWMAVSQNNVAPLQVIFETRADEFGILPNGIEIVGPPSKQEGETLRLELCDELGLTPGAKLLLTTGRLVRAKGYADLLSIVPKVIDRFSDAIFIWAGEGKMRGLLEQEVRQRGMEHHVRFLGYRSDIDRLLAPRICLFFRRTAKADARRRSGKRW